jgi:hypothetical protein
MTTKAALLASLWLVSVGCTRRPGPEPMAPTPPPPPTTTSPAAATPARDEPVDLTPVQLAAYSTGSSCNLVHDGEHLYWLTQTMAEETGGKSARAARTGACGATLDCSRTRGAVMRVADSGGPEEVVARTTEWPWRLVGAATSLFWIGYCSSALWTVAKSGGTPKKLGPKNLKIIDHVVEAARVVVADGSGRARRGGSTRSTVRAGRPRRSRRAAACRG